MSALTGTEAEPVVNTMDSFWEYVLVGGAAFGLLLELLALIWFIREAVLVFRETR